jgi:molecular chaperone GrpE
VSEPSGERTTQARRDGRPESEEHASGVEGTEVPAAPEADAAPADGPDEEVLDAIPSMEGLVADLERVVAERDEYLALAQAKQAEFENYKKRVMKQQADHLAHAAAELVDKLLPVLDALDAGVRHGDESVSPMRAQLLGVLEKEGLVRLDPEGTSFDPTEHEAVASEPGKGDEPSVAETFRAGYRWKGRLLRPAMVRVRS